MKKNILLAAFVLLAALVSKAQDSSRVFVATGLSLTGLTGKLGTVLKPAVEFSSGLELVLPNRWFLQGTLDMAGLKYDQQKRDEKSAYLFQNTTAGLLMIGLNGGRHFNLTKVFSISGYAGGGYLGLREPRISLAHNIATQEEETRRDVFGRMGAKFSIQTGIKFLQLIYVDGNIWRAPLSVQGYRVNGFTVVVGAKVGM